MPRPNVLFLMSDEHRADVAGFAGDEVVRTPTMDRLASEGVVFRNAYAASPICIPGRQAMMCGQLPRTCGVEKFGQDLPPFSMTFALRLAQFGYRTTCCGKLHHMGRDQMQGWTQRFAADMFTNERSIPGRHEASWAPWSHRGEKWKWTDAEDVSRARAGYDSRNQRFDTNAVTAAREFLEDYFVDLTFDRATPDRPVLLKVSLLQPHYPYNTEPERLNYYMNRVEPFFDQAVLDHPFLSTRRLEVGEDVTRREVRRATAAYYGMIECIDEHYESVLDSLRGVGQDLDDWWIVYTSDHGEMLGEHGVWEKQKFFEASARVPLIIVPPLALREAWGCAGRVVEENVNLCDLFATLCDACDVPLPEAEATVNGRGLDSRSLLGLMRGDSDAWRERYADESVSQFAGKNLMIKREPIKYQWYEPREGVDWPEVLFDLEADPSESRNLIDEPRYADVLVGMRRRRGELGFGPDADPAYRNAGYAEM